MGWFQCVSAVCICTCSGVRSSFLVPVAGVQGSMLDLNRFPYTSDTAIGIVNCREGLVTTAQRDG
jgi:hypothetical protein